MIREQDEAQKIADDQLKQLKDHPERCAQVSVHTGRHPWVRYHAGVESFLIVDTTKFGALEVEGCSKESLINLFAENPVEILPADEALFSPPEPGRREVWEYIVGGGEEVTTTNQVAAHVRGQAFSKAETR